jgi:hypothetical protein
MKKLLPLFFLTGCSTFDMPSTSLTVEKNIEPMSRNEVILAIQDCESNRTRAVMILANRKIAGRTSDVVVDVTCAPRPSYY